MGKAKWILLLLTWPLGVVGFYMMIVEGFRQNPFALAVHEMLFLLVLFVLVIFASLFRTPVSGERWTALRHALWFSLLAIPSAIFVFLVFILPSMSFFLRNDKFMIGFGVLLVVGIVIYGALCAYREVVVR